MTLSIQIPNSPWRALTPLSPYTFAEVRGGRLRGRVNATTGMRSFLGIRYAAPPLGDLRWREPLPEPQRAAQARRWARCGPWQT